MSLDEATKSESPNPQIVLIIDGIKRHL